MIVRIRKHPRELDIQRVTALIESKIGKEVSSETTNVAVLYIEGGDDNDIKIMAVENVILKKEKYFLIYRRL